MPQPDPPQPPQYSLYHMNTAGTWINCGSVLVLSALPGGVNHIGRGKTGQGNAISGSQYTAKAGGNGTYSDPAAGDTLFLNGLKAKGSDGTENTFSGIGEWTAATDEQSAGYYTGDS